MIQRPFAEQWLRQILLTFTSFELQPESAPEAWILTSNVRMKPKPAIQACLKSVELTPTELSLPGPHPGDLAFLAMSHFQLGNKDEAAEYRQQFVEAMKLDVFKDDEENLGFAMEVEALFASASQDSAAQEANESQSQDKQ